LACFIALSQIKQLTPSSIMKRAITFFLTNVYYYLNNGWICQFPRLDINFGHYCKRVSLV